ncbi:MAG: PhzF family phenazine biosynthesis protein, partial [Bacteroidota bacterium]
YPHIPVTGFDIPQETLTALGINTLRHHFYAPDLESLFLELDTEADIKSLRPAFPALVKSSSHLKEVVVLCYPESGSHQVVLRSFCPWIGIDEDPVTGSIHAALAPYLNQYRSMQGYTAYQASARGGTIKVHLSDSSVWIGGTCRILVEGKLSS